MYTYSYVIIVGGTINDNTYFVPLMTSIFSGIVLLCIILTIYIMLSAYSRKRQKQSNDKYYKMI